MISTAKNWLRHFRHLLSGFNFLESQSTYGELGVGGNTDANEFFYLFFDKLPFGAALYEVKKDAKGRAFDFICLDVNAAFEKMACMGSVNYIGQSYSCTLVVDQCQTSHFFSLLNNAVFDNNTESIEIHVTYLSRFIEISAMNLQNGKVLAIFSDITDQKRQKIKLEQANRDSRMLSDAVSHDIRAPINAVKSLSTFALKYSDREHVSENNELLKRIVNSIDKTSNNIDKLLELIRLSFQETKFQSVNLSAVAEEVINEQKKKYPNVKVETVIEQGIEVCGDLQLMSTVMANLIGNAWKFSSKMPKARIEFGTKQKDGQRIYYVRDNGVGFDMRYADKLFIPFKRMHAERDFQGTGMGLAFSKKIIEMHKGEIWGESKPPYGTTFYFCLGNNLNKQDI